MSDDAISPELKALADVLVDVLVRGLIADYKNTTGDSADLPTRKCKQITYKKTPGPFGDSPGRSGVLQKQRSSNADSNMAVSMGSPPEGKTGHQNLTI